MNIVTIVRTRDEEKNIKAFIQSYLDMGVNKIIVADGGSVDDTVSIAESMGDKVDVIHFKKKLMMDGDLWRNPEGSHFNFLIKHAMEVYNPDWILQDDCDCRPNKHLKMNLRDLLYNTSWDWVYAVRVYTWRPGTHFENKAQPGGRGLWEASMYGWRASKIRPVFYDTDMAYSWTEKVDDKEKRLDLMPPYCLLHDYYVDRQDKVDFYRDGGQIPYIQNPEEEDNRLADLEEWMYE